MARFQFETTRYEFAHGKKPRGFGMWAFDVHFANDQTTTMFTPVAMTYADAKNWFCRQFSDRGVGDARTVRRVYVAS